MKGIVGSNRTGYIGVSQYGPNRYGATAKIGGVRVYIGSYKTALDAAHAYDLIVMAFRDGPTNFPPQSYTPEEISQTKPRIKSLTRWLQFNGYTNVPR